MKTILSLIFCVTIFKTNFSQEKLYYFINPSDSLVGVKNSSGRAIIPPKYNYLYQNIDDLTTPITGATIYLLDWERQDPKTRSVPALSAGDVYDRKGNLLYHPLQYDNSADFFTEGLTRCVENNKAGFANRKGEIVIKPQYDWVSEFYYGYAVAYNGCSVDYEKDPEHPPFVFDKNADTFYINRKGEQIMPSNKPASPKDQLIFGKYFPYNFVYTEIERKLLDSFDKKKVISKIAFSNYYPLRKGKEAQLQFEITESQADGSLIVTAFDWNNGEYSPHNDLNFIVDKDGKWYHEDLYYGKETFKAWVKRELKSCKDFFTNHPDAPHRFNTDQY